MGKMTAEELLAGSTLQHEVRIPAELLENADGDGSVSIRPLTVLDLQRISQAAGDDESRATILMIQSALIEPEMAFEQIGALKAGLGRFLVEQIQRVSGITTPRSELEDVVTAPLARACYVLAREFGWTVEESSGLTIGQILLYLQMAQQDQERTVS